MAPVQATITTAGQETAVSIIRRTFLRAASSSFLDDLKADHRRAGIGAAIRARDTSRLFRSIVATLSYQGISDRVAAAYMDQHGQIGWGDVEAIVNGRSPCPKLQSYWHFENCGYRKSSATCSRPDLLQTCGLPNFPLRNGRLNQTAVSLYLFIRDVAGGDLAGWIDSTLREHAGRSATERAAALVEGMRCIYGVSDKLLSMLLSWLLLGVSRRCHLWFETGASFVVVDTLVHNYLHRTGVMAAVEGEHPYGPGCYGENGCAAALQTAADQIDARLFNAAFPMHFPRFVQHAIWRFCAQEGLDVCNGNRVDDRQSCENAYCPDFGGCRRMPLRPAKPSKNTVLLAS
jgi:hypothetical protein